MTEPNNNMNRFRGRIEATTEGIAKGLENIWEAIDGLRNSQNEWIIKTARIDSRSAINLKLVLLAFAGLGTLASIIIIYG